MVHERPGECCAPSGRVPPRHPPRDERARGTSGYGMFYSSEGKTLALVQEMDEGVRVFWVHGRLALVVGAGEPQSLPPARGGGHRGDVAARGRPMWTLSYLTSCSLTDGVIVKHRSGHAPPASKAAEALSRVAPAAPANGEGPRGSAGLPLLPYMLPNRRGPGDCAVATGSSLRRRTLRTRGSIRWRRRWRGAWLCPAVRWPQWRRGRPPQSSPRVLMKRRRRSMSLTSLHLGPPVQQTALHRLRAAPLPRRGVRLPRCGRLAAALVASPRVPRRCRVPQRRLGARGRAKCGARRGGRRVWLRLPLGRRGLERSVGLVLAESASAAQRAVPVRGHVRHARDAARGSLAGRPCGYPGPSVLCICPGHGRSAMSSSGGNGNP